MSDRSHSQVPFSGYQFGSNDKKQKEENETILEDEHEYEKSFNDISKIGAGAVSASEVVKVHKLSVAKPKNKNNGVT